LRSAPSASTSSTTTSSNRRQAPRQPITSPAGSASGDHYTGLLAIAAGAVLLATGPVTLWTARRTGGSRRRRYLRRSLAVAATPFLTVAAVWFLVFPIGFAYVYTHTGKGAVTPALGVPYERVAVTTSDSLELAAAYVPSRNRAAMCFFPARRIPGRRGC
jgi:hypothetical protein